MTDPQPDPHTLLNVQATATALASCAQSIYEELQIGQPDMQRLEQSQFLYHFWLQRLNAAVAPDRAGIVQAAAKL